MSKIRSVLPKEWGRLEGDIEDMPWLIAENRIVEAFENKQRGSAKLEIIKKNFGCYAQNANDWAAGWNAVIKVLNTLPERPFENALTDAFDVG